jgi:hypothetical protein
MNVAGAARAQPEKRRKSRCYRSQACRVSVTFSPYHFLYPALLLSSELQVTRKLGVVFDNGLGGYKGGGVGQFGIRTPFYATGSFEGGFQVGAFARATKLYLPNAAAVAPASESGEPNAHDGGRVVYFDIEFARANGTDAFYSGLLVGGKYVFGSPGRQFEFLAGFTVEGGALIGYHFLTGSRRFGPHPLATRATSGFLPQFYIDIGWSF